MEIHILIQIRVWMQIRRFVTAAASHLLRRPDMSYHRSAFWRQSTQIFLNNQENISSKTGKYFRTIKKIFLQNQESFSRQSRKYFFKIRKVSLQIQMQIQARWPGVCAGPWSDCMAGSISALQREKSSARNTSFALNTVLNTVPLVHCCGSGSGIEREELGHWEVRDDGWWERRG